MTNQQIIEQVQAEVSKFLSAPIAVRFDAPNDPNGNPRRIWLVKQNRGDGYLVDVCAVDVSYNGNNYLWSIFPNAQEFCSVSVKAGEYKELYKDFEKRGRLIL